MKKFLNEYTNIKKMIAEKKEYKQMMAHVKAMPEDYKYVFINIQKYMWTYAAGTGYDIMAVQYNLVELFESGISNRKKVLEVTGGDVAAFCDELLLNCKTYTENRREKLNREIHEFVING